MELLQKGSQITGKFYTADSSQQNMIDAVYPLVGNLDKINTLHLFKLFKGNKPSLHLSPQIADLFRLFTVSYFIKDTSEYLNGKWYTSKKITGKEDSTAGSFLVKRIKSNIIEKPKPPIAEKKIKEISEIKKLRQALIARMNIVQNLQATRTLTVRLLDEIIRILPEGVYLYQIERVGDKVTLLGYAESNTNISKLMRSIEGSVWIKDPELTEIKKTTDNKLPDENEFKLGFILKSKTALGSTYDKPKLK